MEDFPLERQNFEVLLSNRLTVSSIMVLLKGSKTSCRGKQTTADFQKDMSREVDVRIFLSRS